MNTIDRLVVKYIFQPIANLAAKKLITCYVLAYQASIGVMAFGMPLAWHAYQNGSEIYIWLGSVNAFWLLLCYAAMGRSCMLAAEQGQQALLAARPAMPPDPDGHQLGAFYRGVFLGFMAVEIVSTVLDVASLELPHWYSIAWRAELTLLLGSRYFLLCDPIMPKPKRQDVFGGLPQSK